MNVWPSLDRYVDDVISRIGRMFPDMSIELFRPNGTSAVLLVSFCSQVFSSTLLMILPLVHLIQTAGSQGIQILLMTFTF